MQHNISDDPLVPWGELRFALRGPTGKPLSFMTLHRWRHAGVIAPVLVNGRRYLRLRETLARIEGRDRGAAA